MDDKKEEAFWAKIGRMATLIEDQNLALAMSQNTITKLEEYLDEAELREDFLKWIEKKAQEADEITNNLPTVERSASP